MNIWRRSSVVERLSHKQERVSSILTVATRAARTGETGAIRGGIEM